MTNSLLPSMQAIKLGLAFAVFALASLGFFVSTASAATRFVDPIAVGPTPGTDCGALAGYMTISAAVTDSVAGDTIAVCPATYTEDVQVPAGKDNLWIVGVSLTPNDITLNGGIRTASDGTVISTMTIEGGGSWGDSGGDFPAIWLEGGTLGHQVNTVKLIGPNDGTRRGLLFGIGISDVNVIDTEVTEWLSGVYINPSSNIAFEGLYAHDNVVGIGSDGLDNVTVQKSVFENNTAEGIGSSDVHVGGLSVTRSSFTGNPAGVAHYGGADVIDGTCNWWGEASGPTHASNPGGTGDPVTDNVTFDPWLLSSNLDEECPPEEPPPGGENGDGVGVINSSIIKVEIKNSGSVDNRTSSSASTGGNTAQGSRGGRGGRGGDVEAEAKGSGDANGNNGGSSAGNGGNGGDSVRGEETAAGGYVGTGSATATATTTNSLNDTDVELTVPEEINSSILAVDVDNDNCKCNLVDNTTKARARTGRNDALGSEGGSGGNGGEIEAEAEGSGDANGNNGGAVAGDGGSGGTGSIGGEVQSGVADSSASATNRANTTRVRINN